MLHRTYDPVKQSNSSCSAVCFHFFRSYFFNQSNELFLTKMDCDKPFQSSDVSIVNMECNDLQNIQKHFIDNRT